MRRWLTILAVLVLVGAACGDDSPPEGSASQEPEEPGQPADPAEPAGPDEPEPESSVPGSDPTSPPSTTTTTSEPAPPPDTGPALRLSAIAFEREGCPSVTIAPTITISFGDGTTNDTAGVTATQQLMGETTPATPFDGADFPWTGDPFTLSVFVREDLSGVAHQMTITEPTSVSATLPGGPASWLVDYDVTAAAGTVSLGPITMRISQDCAQLAPTVFVTLTDRDGSTEMWTTDQTTIMPFPPEQVVPVFGPVDAQLSDPAGWSLRVFVRDDWSGRVYEATHTEASAVETPLAPNADTDPAVTVTYTIDVTA